ncbi:unnamed protein product, partial [Urochloa humidicola]
AGGRGQGQLHRIGAAASVLDLLGAVAAARGCYSPDILMAGRQNRRHGDGEH